MPPIATVVPGKPNEWVQVVYPLAGEPFSVVIGRHEVGWFWELVREGKVMVYVC